MITAPSAEPQGHIMGYKVAVVGATGNVGREMLNVLAERNFPVSDLYALASRRSVGTDVSFSDNIVKCRALETSAFKGIESGVMWAGSDISKAWSPRIGAEGT